MDYRLNVSDVELMAQIIASSNKGSKESLHRAAIIYEDAGYNLMNLLTLPLNERLKNVGVTRSHLEKLRVAVCFSQRLKSQQVERVKISCSRDAYELIRYDLEHLPVEQFWCLFLNRANQVRNKIQISSGGQSATCFDLKAIFRLAVEYGASCIIMAHNHPSGNVEPSTADIALTKNATSAGKTLDIPVLDHLIIGAGRYYSFADEGMM